MSVNIKISELPSASTPLTGGELVPIVQGGVTSQTALTNIRTPVYEVSVFTFMSSAEISAVRSNNWVTVTDVTSAVQQALDTVALQGGGILTFPRGTYLLAAGVIVGTKTTVIGEGAASVLKPINGTAAEYVLDVKANGTDVNITNIAFDLNSNQNTQAIANGSNVSNVKIEGCVFYNSNAVLGGAYILLNNAISKVRISKCNFSATTGYVMSIAAYGGANNLVIDNNIMSSTYGGIRINNYGTPCYEVKILNNSITSAHKRAIVLEQVSKGVVEGNTISDTTSTGNFESNDAPFGISCQLACDNVVISNNVLQHGGEISCYDSTNVQIIGNKVTQSNSAGIEVNDYNNVAAPTDCYNVVVSNNIVSASGASGMYISAADVLITGNIVLDSNSNGIKVAENALRVNGFNNIVKNNGNDITVSDWAGLHLGNIADSAPGIVECTWENNIFIDTRTPKKQAYGIVIEGPISNVTLRHNTIYPNGTGTLYTADVTSGLTSLYLDENIVGDLASVPLVKSKLNVSSNAYIDGLTVGKGNGELSGNTVLGYQALYSNVTGTDNVAIGRSALYAVSDTVRNIGIGVSAGQSAVGTDNIAIGYNAGAYFTGDGAVAIGANAAYGNFEYTGSNNIAIGNSASYNGSSGENNIAIGHNAYKGVDGVSGNTGANNILIGNGAGSLLTTASNSVYIGGANGAGLIDNNNSVVISDGAGYNRIVYNGNAGTMYLYTGTSPRLAIGPSGVVTINTLAGSGSRTVTASGTGDLTATSDSSLKQEVVGADIPGLAEIMQVQPKAYKWLSDIENRGDDAAVEIGFFANQVAPIIPSAAPMGTDGLYGFYDRSMIAALVKAVQELKAELDALKGA